MQQKTQRVIVWFRRDLRLSDHPALAQAVSEQAMIIPLFIFDPYLLHHPETGSGRVQFLLGCLDSLHKNLEYLGSSLIRRYGPQEEILPQVAREVRADAVYWNEDTERHWRTTTDQTILQALKSYGIVAKTFRCEALLPPGGKDTYDLKTFTPQWYQFLYQPLFPRPKALPRPEIDSGSFSSASASAPTSVPLFTLKDLGLPPTHQLVPPAGEREAHRLLQEFLNHKVLHYVKSLSVASAASQFTSRLGPHLKFGTISVRQVYHAVQQRQRVASSWERRNLDGFVSRLFWRDHFAQKLRNLPRCETESYMEVFDRVPWSQNQEHYQAWCEGQTGYPLVDAAMRCLNQTGWIPFRLRALCATFLCIDLFLPWQWGAQHYMQMLMDADVAIDHWQWQSHAGVSNRSRKWFRIYNPTDGISKIDPDGTFIRTWLPELAEVPIVTLANPRIFAPNYPAPLVNHHQARKQALAILEPLKQEPLKQKPLQQERLEIGTP